MSEELAKICRVCLAEGSRDIFCHRTTNTDTISSLDRIVEKYRFVTMLKVRVYTSLAQNHWCTHIKKFVQKIISRLKFFTFFFSFLHFIKIFLSMRIYRAQFFHVSIHILMTHISAIASLFYVLVRWCIQYPHIQRSLQPFSLWFFVCCVVLQQNTFNTDLVLICDGKLGQ